MRFVLPTWMCGVGEGALGVWRGGKVRMGVMLEGDGVVVSGGWREGAWMVGEVVGFRARVGEGERRLSKSKGMSVVKWGLCCSQ